MKDFEQIKSNEKEDEKKLYDEPSYAREFIESGKIGSVFFRGQTVVVIPRQLFEKIGEDTILGIATEIYGEDVMKYDIHWSGEAKNSYILELPPTLPDKPERKEMLDKLIKELYKEAENQI